MKPKASGNLLYQYQNKEFPFAKGPVKVPLRRISENKFVANHSAVIAQSRSKSAPKVKQTLKQSLLSDYGVSIHSHLKQLESQVEQTNFLGGHQIQAEFRAKMVDWMLEVLTTFKNSDQSFFLSINIMDRYFKQNMQNLPSSELHLTGVVSMFIASKYEDIVPLMMKTVINKIGHNKFQLSQVEEKELEILKTLGFNIGSPTVKEYVDRMVEQLGGQIIKPELLNRQLACLTKMTCYSYSLQQTPTSLLAAGIITLALKQGLIQSAKAPIDSLINLIADFSQHKIEDILDKSNEMLKFVRNFETDFPQLRNLKIVYGDVLKTLKFYNQKVLTQILHQNGPSQ
eukprot:403347112